MPGFPRISIDLLFNAALAATIGFGAQAFIPAPALAEDCPGHPDALGTSRVLVVDPAKIHHVGVMQYPQSLPLADKEVVLTFDDGPWPGTTPRVLDALKNECVRATFFLLGRNTTAHPQIARRALAEGHSIDYEAAAGKA